MAKESINETKSNGLQHYTGSFKHVEAKIEIVTPHMAKEWLERAEPNRHFNQSYAAMFADDMRNGRWENNGQPIILDTAGRLLDGQHRLSAVLASGMSIAMLIVRGVATQSIRTIDTGRPRSVGNILQINGFKYSIEMASVSRLVHNYVAGTNLRYNPSKQVIIAIAERHENKLKRAVTLVKTRHSKNIVPTSPLAAVLALATPLGLHKEAEAFADGCIYGEGLWGGDARLTLRRWLDNERASIRRGTSHITVDRYFAAIARCWKAYAEGRELKHVSIPAVINRDTISITGFDARDWPDISDITDKVEEQRLASLSEAQRLNRERYEARKLAEKMEKGA